ncbi:MAG TPA: hypothetical protein DDW27_21635 [Bacteroidales bacterium]|nr:hypothetical protein [Bacteroidales bacterium]
MHIGALTDKQLSLLPYLSRFKRSFYLVGGTAIALHIGHRRSVDFDLFSRSGLNKKLIRNKLSGIPFKITRLSEDTDQIHFLINNIKVTFFNFPFSIDHPLRLESSLTIPSLLTLASMKAYALGRRAKWKDYVDLYHIIRNFHTIEEISAEAISKFGELYSEKLFREQLAFHKDIDYSESVEFLTPAPSEQEIKRFLIDRAIDIGIG